MALVVIDSGRVKPYPSLAELERKELFELYVWLEILQWLVRSESHLSRSALSLQQKVCRRLEMKDDEVWREAWQLYCDLMGVFEQALLKVLVREGCSDQLLG